MPVIPAFLLNQLYVKGSLRVADGDTHFTLHNHLASATINSIALTIDGESVQPEKVTVDLRGVSTPLTDISPQKPLHFPYDSDALVEVKNLSLAEGSHHLEIRCDTSEIGSVTVSADDQPA